MGLIKNGIYILVVSLLGLFLAWSLFDVPLNQWSMLGALLIPLVVVLRTVWKARSAGLKRG